MNLKIQIISLLVSLIYGYIFSILVNINYYFLFSKKKSFKILMNIIFVLDCGLLYFFIIKKINNANIHYYLYIMIVIGFLLGYIKTRFLREYLLRYYCKLCKFFKI